MNEAEYTSEYICRFPMPKEMPPIWVSVAEVSHGSSEYRNSNGTPPHTAIAYVVSGSGMLRTARGQFPLGAGDLCILGENVEYAFEKDATVPWTKIVFQLEGAAVFPVVQAFGLEKKQVYHGYPQLQPQAAELLACVQQDIPAEEIMDRFGMLLMKLLIRLQQLENQDTSIPDDVRAVKRFIDNNYHRNLSMEEISASVFRSNDYIQKRFKQVYGMTPYGYYMELRMRCAKSLLQQTNLSIAQIADKLGYKSDRYFSARFRSYVGMTALAYRKHSRSETRGENL